MKRKPPLRFLDFFFPNCIWRTKFSLSVLGYSFLIQCCWLLSIIYCMSVRLLHAHLAVLIQDDTDIYLGEMKLIIWFVSLGVFIMPFSRQESIALLWTCPLRSLHPTTVLKYRWVILLHTLYLYILKWPSQFSMQSSIYLSMKECSHSGHEDDKKPQTFLQMKILD